MAKHSLDFSEADKFDVIPHETEARVRMTIRPGGYNDPDRGWNGGYVTASLDGESFYLRCEFVVLEGPYSKRRFWDNIGLFSHKNNDAFGLHGRKMLKRALDSHFGLEPENVSDEANALRAINGLEDIDGLEFTAKVCVKQDKVRGAVNGLLTPVLRKDSGKAPGGAPPAAPAPMPPEGRQGPQQLGGRPGWAS